MNLLYLIISLLPMYELIIYMIRNLLYDSLNLSMLS